jgi:hypothetical protein
MENRKNLNPPPHFLLAFRPKVKPWLFFGPSRRSPPAPLLPSLPPSRRGPARRPTAQPPFSPPPRPASPFPFASWAGAAATQLGAAQPPAHGRSALARPVQVVVLASATATCGARLNAPKSSPVHPLPHDARSFSPSRSTLTRRPSLSYHRLAAEEPPLLHPSKPLSPP